MNEVSLEERRQTLTEWQAGAITFTEYRQRIFGDDNEKAMQILNQVVEERRLLRGT